MCALFDANPAQLSSNCSDSVGEAAVYKIETAASTFEIATFATAGVFKRRELFSTPSLLSFH
jgi:hypothetical protein